MDNGFTRQSIPRLLLPDQLRQLLGISKATMYRLVEKRAFPFYKIGGSLRFNYDEVMEYVAMCRVRPTNEYEHTQKKK